MIVPAARFRFLADECLSVKIVEDLRVHGLDVDWVHEFDPSAKDPRVLVHATERQRILPILDYDFGDLIVRKRLPALGVVLFALQRLSRNSRLVAIRNALDGHVDEMIGNLLIVEAGRVRRRALDPGSG
jgi:predicted nuclease of predicted toxin-antitoxin system